MARAAGLCTPPWPDSKQVGWNKRYFVITGNVLYYFKTQEVGPPRRRARRRLDRALTPRLVRVRLAAPQEKIPSAIIPLENLAVREVDLGGVLDLGGSRFAFELYNPDNEV